MPKIPFPGLPAFIPPDEHEAINTAMRTPLLSQIGSILGQAAEHEDPAAQASIVVEAKRLRGVFATQLKAVDDAIATFEPEPEPTPKAKATSSGASASSSSTGKAATK